ncbi:hypothetical protein B0H34DRAFT_158451 [Crassisporium funariophilum]|nr:hypothetical protein B0H34DRAFT_158451 [Crassisporium funariophilum]
MMEQHGLVEPSQAHPIHETYQHHLQPPSDTIIGPIGIYGSVFSGHTTPIINQGSGNIHNASNHYHSHTRGMKSLHKSVAPGAIHNALKRQDPPKCHASTREAVIRDIMHWIEELEKECKFMWVHGPAGAGKSAILQTIAELCHKAGLLGASFFFSRNAAGLNDADLLVPTLVYQLCISIPEMRSHVEVSLEQDPLILSRSVEAQLESLLLGPLTRAACDPLTEGLLRSRPRLIILDGLDECGQPKTQRHLLTLLSGAALKLPIPLFFLIASRPEQHIRNTFISQPLVSTTSLLALDDSYLPGKDIETFLRSRFEEIRQPHPRLSTSWPSAADIRRLVNQSSGQFIYASTVINYVDSARHEPDERLKIIFGIKPAGKETPFAELDALYKHIFSCVENLEKVLEVLGSLLIWNDVYEDFIWPTTPKFVEIMLCLPPGEIAVLFGDLCSIVYIPVERYQPDIRILHASLWDFLLDESRSGRFHIHKGRARTCLALYSLRHVEEHIRDPDFIINSALENDKASCRILSYTSFFSRCIQVDHTESLLEKLQGLDFFAFIDLMIYGGKAYDEGSTMHFIQYHFRLSAIERLPQYFKWLEKLDCQSQMDVYSLHLKSWERHINKVLLPLSSSESLIATNLITSLTLNSFIQECVKTIICDSANPDEVILYDKLPRHSQNMLGFFDGLSHTMVVEYLHDPRRSEELCVNNPKYLMLAKSFVQYVFKMDPERWEYDGDNCSNKDCGEIQECLEDHWGRWWGDKPKPSSEDAYHCALKHLPFLLRESCDSREFADFLGDHPLPPDSEASSAYPDRAKVIDAIAAYITRCDSAVKDAQPVETHVRNSAVTDAQPVEDYVRNSTVTDAHHVKTHVRSSKWRRPRFCGL